MPVLDKQNIEEIERYTDFVSSHPNKSLLQDISWALVKSEWKSEYVYIERDNEIVAAMSILIRSIPGGYTLFYAPRGPICDLYDMNLLKELIEEVKDLAKKYKAFVLKMDPEVKYTNELNDLLIKNGFKVKNRNAELESMIQLRNNMIVNLEGSDEESIMMRFTGKLRTKIRSSIKKGVYTSWDVSDEYIEKFYEVYSIMSKRNKINQRNIEYFYQMRDALGDKLRIYLTHHEDDILSVAIAVNYYGKVYYLYSGSNDIKRNLHANSMMNYDIMKWGIESGASQYDFGGVLNMDEHDGLYQFKRPFCHKDGVTEYIGEIDFVYNRFLFFLYNNVLPVMQKLKKKFANSSR